MTVMTRNGARRWWKEELPHDIAYLYHDGVVWGGKPKWKAVTYKELLAEKVAHQQSELGRKRCHAVTIPCFIQVFYIPDSMMPMGLFCGWWIYVITLKKSYGINFRHERDNKLIQKAMELFSYGVLPLLENFDEWAKSFAHQHNRAGFKRDKNQGLVKCYCTIDEYGKPINIQNATST